MTTIHGHTRDNKRSPTHSSWTAMMNRCFKPYSNRYYAYGAKGVTVCERWLSFENFLADLGPRPDGCTLGRKNDEGNYEPGNAWWQTTAEQSRRGERNHQARLNEYSVLAARALFVKGAKRGCSLRNMARDLGVSEATLCEALSGKTWAHL